MWHLVPPRLLRSRTHEPIFWNSLEDNCYQMTLYCLTAERPECEPAWVPSPCFFLALKTCTEELTYSRCYPWALDKPPAPNTQGLRNTEIELHNFSLLFLPVGSTFNCSLFLFQGSWILSLRHSHLQICQFSTCWYVFGKVSFGRYWWDGATHVILFQNPWSVLWCILSQTLIFPKT